MRYTEFWARMERVLGPAYARTWAEQQVISDLGHRTVAEALAAQLRRAADWQGLGEVVVEPRGDLAPVLAAVRLP